MADDDIYGSKKSYEWFKRRLDNLLPGSTHRGRGGVRKYRCRNPNNLRHFKALCGRLEARDLSYIRRIRLLQSLRFLVSATEKDLALCDRDDIDGVMALAHDAYKTPISKQTFVKDLKCIWKMLFTERDEKGRPDENLVPYAVRHLSIRVDRSRQKLREDKLTQEEFERVVSYFGSEPRMQAFLTLALESLARPQELLYVRMRRIELFDSYAKVFIGEHGKEGVGLLQCIDSYPYLLKWLDVHPLRGDPNAFLFVNTGDTNRCQQLRPKNVNKLIRKACKDLGINKPITCYSLKRNGVTMRRLRGESDMEIQHAARWASTKQLKTYDLSSQEEAFSRKLQRRGLMPAASVDPLKAKQCEFCGTASGFEDVVCQRCKRPLERDSIRKEAQSKENELKELKGEVARLTNQLLTVRGQIVQEVARELLRHQRFPERPASENPRRKHARASAASAATDRG